MQRQPTPSPFSRSFPLLLSFAFPILSSVFEHISSHARALVYFASNALEFIRCRSLRKGVDTSAFWGQLDTLHTPLSQANSRKRLGSASPHFVHFFTLLITYRTLLNITFQIFVSASLNGIMVSLDIIRTKSDTLAESLRGESRGINRSVSQEKSGSLDLRSQRLTREDDMVLC